MRGTMTRTLSPESLQEITARLARVHEAFQRRYPGATGDRQPVHTVYGGPIFWEATHAREVMLAYRDFLPTAPEGWVPSLA